MAARSLSLPRVGPRALPSIAVGHARMILAVIAAAAALIGGWMFLRDSSLVAADQVTITGVSGPQAHQIEQALRSAAGEMTTLHMRPRALQQAVASYPLVKAVHAKADFPHKVHITVVEHKPVAAVVVSGRAIPVAADGTILRGAFVPGLLRLPSRTPVVGRRLTKGPLLSAARIMAAAPASMRSRVTKIFLGPRGMSVRVTGAPPAIFGSANRAKAKWISLMTMLASGQIAGATQIDLSVPERPAVAGLPGPQIGPTGTLNSQPAVEGTQ